VELLNEIRVLVVDDHPVVRMGLGSMLGSQKGIKVVGMVASGGEALTSLPKVHPDVVLMDLRMPEMDGVDAIVALRAAEPNVKILVLTNYQMDEDVFNALQAGALGYLVKSAPQEDVIHAIRTVNQGKLCIPPVIAAKLAERISHSSLSPREMEVLQFVAKGLTNTEIGSILFISDKTARNHVISLMAKLEAKDRTEAVTIAIRKGLIRVAQ
jgi:two-component system NarL family response regulator